MKRKQKPYCWAKTARQQPSKFYLTVAFSLEVNKLFSGFEVMLMHSSRDHQQELPFRNYTLLLEHDAHSLSVAISKCKL